MSSSSNTVAVKYDIYKTNTDYTICITTPNFMYTIKPINSHTSTQRKNTQKKVF